MILSVPPYTGCVTVGVGDAVGDAVGEAVGDVVGVGVSALPQLANNNPPMIIRTNAINNILFTLGITSSFYWVCPIERSPVISFT